MDDLKPRVAVLGASGLIGQAIAMELIRSGLSVVPIARHLTTAQQNAFAGLVLECPVTSMDSSALAGLLAERHIDVVVNCIGVLQDTRHERADDVHRRFVARLLDACHAQRETTLLVHISIPGSESDDETTFSRTKRYGERLIAAGPVPFVILRPGFVVAATAYGGSALIRALAALPLNLPRRESACPFATTDIGDIARTVGVVVRRWRGGERHWAATWDVMARDPSTVSGVVEAFRHRFGGPPTIGFLPARLMDIGARAGDLVAELGWRPPIRSTALREMRRGVQGDPAAWIAATRIDPASLEDMLAQLPSTVQERWFARLYLLKALIIGLLAVFWSVSGLIALTVAYHSAAAILTSHGVPQGLARGLTLVTGLCNVLVGAAISVRKTSRRGLVAGVALSLCYLAGAILVAPELWLDPLGSLVKTVPAITLMLVALAILDDR
jgi:nucleoside-diphosphate-sugar epimerase